MKKAWLMKRILPILLLALYCTGSWAAASDTLELVSKVEKEVTVVSKDGKKEVKRGPAVKVLPGDVVVFTNHYLNAGQKPADDAVITNPVPKDVTYLAGSAFGEGARIAFSINKGETFDTPGNLFKTEKGKKRSARANEYSHIRWTFSTLAAGKEGIVGFKARIK